VRIGEAVADLNLGAAFSCGASAMNYQAFTNDSLTMMYEGIRGALEVHDTLQ
jgi:hypothetical protein